MKITVTIAQINSVKSYQLRKQYIRGYVRKKGKLYTLAY